MKSWLRENRRFILICALLAAVHIALIFFYGMQKEGFHEDELYSFATSSGIKTITPGNYQWKTGYQVLQGFMVVEGEEFAFEEVVQNQIEDVHPPLFYLALNVVMSLFPNHFFKWFGIGLNLIYSLIAYAGILFFFYRLDQSRKRPEYALIAGAVYVISPATVSNVMLVRMYALSSMWTILYACLFLILIQDFRCSKKRFACYTLSGALICYLAFLTHYFALLIPFFLTLGYCIYALLQKKNVIRMLLYGLSMLAAIGLSILTYPASMDHIFNGYRGDGVFDSLSSPELFATTKTFLIILNDNMFAGMLVPILLVTAAALFAGMLSLIRKRKSLTAEIKLQAYCLMVCLVGCIITFYFLSRSALLVGEDSCRFFYPVTVLLVPLMAYCVCKGFMCVLHNFSRKKETILSKAVLPGLLLIVLIPSLAGFAKGNILFLYRENAERKAIIQEYQDYPAIMIYDKDTSYRSWYAAEQLWMFSRVFYMDSEHFLADFEDATIETAEKMIVYVDAPAEYLEKLLLINPKLEKITLLWQDDFHFVYAVE